MISKHYCLLDLASGFSGNLSGNVSGPQNSTVINNGVVTNSMLATPVTSNATANTIMERDSTGSSKVIGFNVSGVLTGNDYTGSYLNLTLNNTNQNAISILSGNTSKDVYLAVGRTTDEIFFGVTGTSGAVWTGVNPGDMLLVSDNSSNNICIGTDSTTYPMLSISSTSATVNGNLNIPSNSNTLTSAGNLTLTNTGSSNERVITLNRAFGNGYIFSNYPGLGSGEYFSYNYYFPSGGSSYVIPNSGGATSMIRCGFGSVSIGAGNTNSPPVIYLNILDTGVVQTANGAIFMGNLTGNVTGNCSGSAATFTGNLAGVVSGLMSATTLSSASITNAMLATASSANNPNYVVVRDGSGNFSAGTITATSAFPNGTPVATGNNISYMKNYNTSTNWTGAVTSGSVNFSISKINQMVTLVIDVCSNFTTTSSNNLTLAATVPASFLPTQNVGFSSVWQYNSITNQNVVVIGTISANSGTIILQLGNTASGGGVTYGTTFSNSMSLTPFTISTSYVSTAT